MGAASLAGGGYLTMIAYEGKGKTFDEGGEG